MMFTEIKQKPFEYLILLLLLLISALAFIYFSYDSFIQRRVIYISAAAYFMWSLYHHYRRGDLQPSIVIEYLLIGIFGIVLLSSTLF